MARQFSVPYQIPPILLLPAAADAAGRTSVYKSLRHGLKSWILVEVNQGNAATVLLSILQATDTTGAGSKALTANCPIWLNADTTASDAYVAQAAAAGTFTTSATLKQKLVLFEIVPEQCMDIVNGFRAIGVSTGASNAANITRAELLPLLAYQQATPPSFSV